MKQVPPPRRPVVKRASAAGFAYKLDSDLPERLPPEAASGDAHPELSWDD